MPSRPQTDGLGAPHALHVVHLVRHAKAYPRRRYTGDDLSRPLSADGQLQAQAIAAWFEGPPAVQVRRIVSSPAARCVETVEPLAARRGLPIEELERLAEGSTAGEALAALVAAADDAGGPGDVVACSHGDVIFSLLVALADAGVIGPDDVAVPKGATWKLTIDQGMVADASFRPAPTLERS